MASPDHPDLESSKVLENSRRGSVQPLLTRKVEGAIGTAIVFVSEFLSIK